MKKKYTYLLFIFVLSLGVSFISIGSNKALGQTSSSSGSAVVLSDKFSGLWSAKVDRTVSVNGVVVREGTRTIRLRLCSKNGEIKGIVIHPGFFTRALIISQNVISENEIDVDIKDRRGRTATLRLTLVGDLQLNGAFSNGVNFESTKKSEFRLCQAFRTCDINDLFNTKEFDN
jgi:hypothetical protein